MKRTLLTLAAASALLGGVSASFAAATKTFREGTTPSGDRYRIAFAGGADWGTCLRAQLAYHTAASQICFGDEVGARQMSASVAARTPMARRRRPWLVFGVTGTAVARVLVTFDDLTTAEAVPASDPALAGDVRFFELLLADTRRTVKRVDGLDAAGRVVAPQQEEEGPVHLLARGRAGDRSSWATRIGWVPRSSRRGFLLCPEVSVTVRVEDGTETTGATPCTRATTDSAWYLREQPAGRRHGTILFGGVPESVRTVRVSFGGREKRTLRLRTRPLPREFPAALWAGIRVWTGHVPRGSGPVREIAGFTAAGRRVRRGRPVWRGVTPSVPRFCRENPGAC